MREKKNPPFFSLTSFFEPDSLTANLPSPSGVLFGCGQVGVILGAAPFVKEDTVIQRTMAALGRKRKEDTGQECVECQCLNSCHRPDFAEVV